jgi:K+-sensing histidine kinase KdpD
VRQEGTEDTDNTVRLLRSIADQLKLPLTAIARQADLGLLTGKASSNDLQTIGTHATTALRLVDSYLLGLHLLQDETTLSLEPVSVSSMLTETAHELDDLAKQYGVELELHIGGKYAPVMAHRVGLKSALISLGATMLENGHDASHRLTLAVHRTPHGIVTGMYGNYVGLNAQRWRKALALQGTAAQPLKVFGGNGAGLFVAETILQAMSTRLRVGKHLNQQGLATTLQSSQQLSIV